ncbi:MAG: hypothetical protein HOP29_13770 [Phycisphaerales bacterium]|nr:hypothetical protein [Phycisphaerales bacterium]
MAADHYHALPIATETLIADATESATGRREVVPGFFWDRHDFHLLQSLARKLVGKPLQVREFVEQAVGEEWFRGAQHPRAQRIKEARVRGQYQITYPCYAAEQVVFVLRPQRQRNVEEVLFAAVEFAGYEAVGDRAWARLQRALADAEEEQFFGIGPFKQRPFLGQREPAAAALALNLEGRRAVDDDYVAGQGLPHDMRLASGQDKGRHGETDTAITDDAHLDSPE